MIYIFDWIGDFIGGIGSAIGSVFDYLGEQISNAIWNTMLQWFYETIYNAVADFFTMMGNMGAGDNKPVYAFRLGIVCRRDGCCRV